MAITGNGLKHHKACGVAVSLISGELDVGSYLLPTAPAGDNVTPLACAPAEAGSVMSVISQPS
jgi:hypothetical protein